MAPSAALSVDFELFKHLPAYRRAKGTTESEQAGLGAVDFLLDTLTSYQSKSTFFVVSEIAETNPDVIRRIGTEHELASHSVSHPFLSQLGQAERLDQMTDSKVQLEDVSGKQVSGFRAPSFDISDDHFDLLNDAGYAYDSSVVPSRKIPGWYGGKYTQQRPCSAGKISKGATDTVVEVPVGVMPALRLPLTGTWLRFFGVQYTRIGMRWLARQGISPVLYVHPWEFVDLPAVEGVPKRLYFRTGQWMRRALKRILEEPFDFTTIRSIAENF